MITTVERFLLHDSQLQHLPTNPRGLPWVDAQGLIYGKRHVDRGTLRMKRADANIWRQTRPDKTRRRGCVWGGGMVFVFLMFYLTVFHGNHILTKIFRRSTYTTYLQ